MTDSFAFAVHRGNYIHAQDGVWVYSDTFQPVVDNPDRECGHCALPNRADGHDACVGELEPAEVMNACCGHGEDRCAYVQFWDGRRIDGDEALVFMRGRR